MPLTEAGAASGVLTAVQQLAGALGVALSGLLFFHGRSAGGTDAMAAYAAGYLQVLALFAGLLVAGGVACCAIGRTGTGVASTHHQAAPRH